MQAIDEHIIIQIHIIGIHNCPTVTGNDKQRVDTNTPLQDQELWKYGYQML